MSLVSSGTGLGNLCEWVSFIPFLQRNRMHIKQSLLMPASEGRRDCCSAPIYLYGSRPSVVVTAATWLWRSRGAWGSSFGSGFIYRILLFRRSFSSPWKGWFIGAATLPASTVPGFPRWPVPSRLYLRFQTTGASSPSWFLEIFCGLSSNKLFWLATGRSRIILRNATDSASDTCCHLPGFPLVLCLPRQHTVLMLSASRFSKLKKILVLPVKNILPCFCLSTAIVNSLTSSMKTLVCQAESLTTTCMVGMGANALRSSSPACCSLDSR